MTADPIEDVQAFIRDIRRRALRNLQLAVLEGMIADTDALACAAVEQDAYEYHTAAMRAGEQLEAMRDELLAESP